MTEKLITDWRAATAADAAALAKWGQLHGPLSSTAGLQGEPKIRNDDQLMVVLCVSKAAQERVTRAARDAASLAQEWAHRAQAAARLLAALASPRLGQRSGISPGR